MLIPQPLIATDNITEEVSRSRHGNTLLELGSHFLAYSKSKTPRPGRVYLETDLYFSPESRKYIPDLAFTLPENQLLNLERDVLIGIPDLIVEVLSPSSMIDDTTRKFNDYQNAGVREYWIVFPEQRQITVYQLLNAVFEVAQSATRTGFIQSKQLPDFKIGLEEIFERD